MSDPREAFERRAVREIGDRLGYGRVMQLCEEIWVEKLKREGIGTNGSGAKSVGPCVGMLVPCPCTDRVSCDWCCGAGRVTKRVAEAARVDAREADRDR